MKKICKNIFAVVIFAIAMPSFSAPIYTVENNNLVSVSGIEYDGSVWNVEFGDSCTTMYNGCSDSGLFAFNNSMSAEGALLALYNQAINDGVVVNNVTYNFDTQTELMFSIDRVDFAEIWVPFATNGTVATSVWGYHRDSVNDLTVADTNANWAVDYGNNEGYMAFTRWTQAQVNPASAPGMLFLMAFGIFALIAKRRVAR